MKRLMMVALFLVVASLPARAATVDCYSFTDSYAVWDWQVDYCVYEQSSLCMECFDYDTKTGCAADAVCDPNWKGWRKPVVLLGQLSPVRRNGTVPVADAQRGRPSQGKDSVSSRPVTTRVAGLNAGTLL